jgi:amidohydrolase
VSDLNTLKGEVCRTIDAHADRIVALGEAIMDTPELGFRERRTAGQVKDALTQLGLTVKAELALTGLRADLAGGGPGPRVAVLGELDAVRVPQHPRADPSTGAAHACGHNAQLAGMYGAALGLIESGVVAQLDGSVAFMAVPAEEYCEIDYRMELIKNGQIEFPGGKPEFVRLGLFDDVDMAMMVHTSSPEQGEGSMGVAVSSNGFLAKRIHFTGRAAHAGLAPERGVNALNAAHLALAAIHAQRETFRDEDCVRVHPIITHGGDLVNVVPAEVELETYVRARTWEAIVDAAAKVDRAVKGAAVAMGCRAVIDTLPGYMPLRNDAELARVFKRNGERLFGAGTYRDYPHSGGSTDAGDLSQIMPLLHPAMTGAAGAPHETDWHIADQAAGYVAPAKALAMMVVDLLAEGSAGARRVLDQSAPPLNKEGYLKQARAIFATDEFDGAQI